MAPSRGVKGTRGSVGSTRSSRRSADPSNAAKNEIPDVYQDMLNEAEADALFEDSSFDADRPLKKRRVISHASTAQSAARIYDGKEKEVARQTAEASSSESEDDSNVDFEDVDLDMPEPLETKSEEHGIADVSITINPATQPQRRMQPKRKPASASEKAYRLLVHKLHLLSLLGHCMYVNSRCNDEQVQNVLRKLVPKKTVAWLNHPAQYSQFDRDRVFMDGLKQASEVFRGSFMITESGMQRARWISDGDQRAEQTDFDPLDRAAFLNAAEEMRGSQDTGNQLFCAMLRSIGVEARLVCSLQCLPFGKPPVHATTTAKIIKPVVYATALATQSEDSESNADDKSVKTSATVGKIPAVRRRLGQPGFEAEPPTPPPATRKKGAPRKLAYPVFWVEAFNSAYQQWVAVDPLVTQTVSKQPSRKIEPPSLYGFNQMTYVFAFESTGVVRDVTRRYARAFNAKTRRNRVESTHDGTQWLKKALRIFRRRGPALDRDAIEDAELAKFEAKEGLPGNVQDFKDHPYYALERHLKRHEVIHPKREVGKVNAGTAAKPRMEIVYRRTDVCECRSAEKWFRLGRDVKKGEVPIKRVRARRARQLDDEDGTGHDVEPTMPLYASFQTELYVPAPIAGGKVPKNAYGNLDVYVPSMVPAGGVHVKHPLAAPAARILKIDFADAVTGFQFKGRHGTAITEGVVVAEEYANAVTSIIEALQDEREEEDSLARSAVALRMWRRFLTGLRIKERVSAYGEGKNGDDIEMEIDAAEEAGGFFPNERGQDIAMPTAGKFSLDELMTPKKKQKRRPVKVSSEESADEEDFAMTESEEAETPMISTRQTRARNRVISDDSDDALMPDVPDDDDHDGGFIYDDLYEDANGEGGGFMPIDEDVPDEELGQAGGFMMDDSEPIASYSSAGGFLVDNEQEVAGKVSGELTMAPAEQQQERCEPMEDAYSVELAPTADADAAVPPKSRDDDHQDTQSIPNHEVLSEASHDIPDNGLLLTEDGNAKANGTAGHEDAAGNETGSTENVQEDNTDHGSMLSHDPEDEDAEPDWLESDSN